LALPAPKSPDLETLVSLFGGENFKSELWEELGKSLEISEESLDKIREESDDDMEKRKQSVLHVRNISEQKKKKKKSHSTSESLVMAGFFFQSN